jgi:hypothetical protein
MLVIETALLCILMRVFGARITAGQWDEDCKASHPDYDLQCRETSGVYRIACAAAIVLFAQAIIAPFFVCIYDSYWIPKHILAYGIGALFLFAPYSIFVDNTYTIAARVGGAIFLVLQQVCCRVYVALSIPTPAAHA